MRAPTLMHGKVSNIQHQEAGIFKGLKSPFIATRYHSLIVEASSLPNCLEKTALSEDSLIMGIRHKTHLIFGVQFHPESIASEYGHDLLRYFIETTES